MIYQLVVRHDKHSPYVYNKDYWPDGARPLPEVGTEIVTTVGRVKLNRVHVENGVTTGFATVFRDGADTMKSFTAR